MFRIGLLDDDVLLLVGLFARTYTVDVLRKDLHYYLYTIRWEMNGTMSWY